MLTVSKPQVNARLSEIEQTSLTEFLNQYQTANSCVFANFREFLVHLASNGLPAESTNLGDVIEVNEVKPALTAYSERNELPIELSSVEIVNHALTNIPQLSTETVEIEVEKAIGENDLLLHLDENMKSALNKVNSNRNVALEENGHEPESIEATAKGLMFNEGNLFNVSDYFFTGL